VRTQNTNTQHYLYIFINLHFCSNIVIKSTKQQFHNQYTCSYNTQCLSIRIHSLCQNMLTCETWFLRTLVVWRPCYNIKWIQELWPLETWQWTTRGIFSLPFVIGLNEYNPFFIPYMHNVTFIILSIILSLLTCPNLTIVAIRAGVNSFVEVIYFALFRSSLIKTTKHVYPYRSNSVIHLGCH